MKKRLLVLILIATLLFAMFALVACATSVVCTSHQWQPFEVVGNGDIKSEVCSKCGATRLLCYPFPHTWKDHVANDNLTHTSTCEVCGIEKDLDHTFADGTPDVHTPMVCLDCGVQIAGEGFHQFVDKNENGICDVCASETICQHVYDEGVVTTSATCLATGEKKYTCTECGDVRTESIDMLAHNWTDWTSNDDGTHSRVCTNGDTHTETEDCVGEDATCLENSNCTVCGGVYQTAPGHIDEDEDGVCDVCDDMFNHRGDDECEHANATIVTIPATCLAPGAIEYNCPDCGAVRIQPIEPLAHNWTDWESNGDGTHSRVCINGDTHTETEDCVGEDATCTEDSNCTVCDGIYQNATGHKDEDDNGTCDVCGAQISSEDTEPNPDDGGTCDHTYDDGEVLVEASCEEEGEVLYTCTKCGDTYTLIVDPLGHLDMAGEFPDYHCDRVTENGEICDASTCEEHVYYNGSGYRHIDGTRTDGLQCLNCGVWVAFGECNITEVNYEPSCTRFGYVGLICAAENETTFLDLDGFVDPTGHIDGDDDGYCDICQTSNTRIENCTHANFKYGDTEDTYTSELIGQFCDYYHNEWNFENLSFHWKECRDCHLLFDFELHSYDIFVTMPPCYSSEGYDVYRCVCGREDDSTRTNFTTLEGNYRTGHPDEDGDYECDNCGTFIDAIHECIDTNGDNHCDYCDYCRCEFVDDIYEMDKDHDHWCDNCGDRLDTCRDENNDGYCDYDVECGKHLDCEDTDGDYCCDECGRSIYPEHECIDENDNACCDICNRHFNHIDEDHDCWCDYCLDQLCVDTDDDCRCDNCGYYGDVWENEFHVDDDHNHVCDKCGEEHPVWQEYSEHYHYSYCDLCSEHFNHVEHSYVIVSQEPNCAYDGPVIPTIIKQCECGHTIRNGWAYNDVEHIDENGDYYCDICENCICDHDYEEEIIVEGDCEEESEIKFTCIYCGDSWTDWYSTGHDFYWQDNGDGTCSAECLNNPEHRIENNYHMDDDGDNYCDYCNANCAHEHVYETREECIIDATCTYEGSYDSVTYCIYCDSELYRETIVIPATGVHNYHEVSGNNPTCGQDGYRDMWCDGGCDSWYQEIIPATGVHNYQEVSGSNPTCNQDGYRYMWCDGCGGSYQVTIPATGEHDYAWYDKVEPTCANAGYDVYYCVNCWTYDYRNEVPATGEHNYYWIKVGDAQHYQCCFNCSYESECEDCYGPEVNWHPATCSADGFVEHNCEKCGYLYSVITEPATGIHSYDSWADNGDGTHAGTCSMCWNATTEPEEHTFGSWMSYGNGTHVGYCDKCYTYCDPIECSGGTATCTDYAWCSQCNMQYGELLPHDYQYVETVAPTCAYEGYELYRCSCSSEEHRNTVPKTNDHNYYWYGTGESQHYGWCETCYESTEPVDCYGGTATCAQQAICEVCYNYYGGTLPHNYQLNADYYNSCLSGEHARYVCTDCHDSYYTNLTPAEGHDVEVVIWSYPTCCTPGTAQVNCRTCGTSYVMTLPCDTENGHSWVPDNNWYNQWEDSCIFSIVFNGYCEYCGIYESYTLPPTLEHNIQELDRVEPTCEEDGYIYYNCTGCSECGKYETLPATGHQNVTEVVVPATCGFDGGKYEVCGDCGETINTLEIYPATGEHSWVTYEAQEPTCTDWGWTEYQECSVCYTTTEHEDYEPTWACVYDQQEIHKDYLVSDATCTSKAVYYYSCLCGACGWNETFEYGEEPVGHVDEDGNMVCEACGGSLCDTCVDDDFNYRCDVCDLSVCVEHDWQFYLHDSNCTEDGYYYDYCYYCGDIRDYNIAEAWGHSYYCSDIDEVEATCTEEGWCTYYFRCYGCGDMYEETEVYPIKDHTYTSSTLPPTCSYMGHWQGTCDYCGYTDSYDIPMIDHVTEIVVIAPSCYVDGFTKEVCTVCHKILDEYDVVPQYGAHVNENGDYNCDRCNASLCTSHDYQQTYNTTHHYDECVNCGAIYPHTISAHYDYDNDNICDVCGACTHLFTTYTYDELNHTGVCDLCGAEVTSGHELVEKGTVEATCGMYGGILYGCTDCDYTYIVKTTDATGEHANLTYDYNENLHWSICDDCGLIVSRERHSQKVEVVVNSSCHYNGCEYLYCTDENCGYAHLYEYDRSCMEYEDDVCVDCGHCMYHSEWNDEDGDGLCDRCGKCIEHTYVLEETFEPTCGEVGKSKYNCSVCGFVLYKDYVIPTGEHDFVYVGLNNPTCNGQGYTIYECQICGKQVNRDFVPATGEHVDVDNDYYCDNLYCGKLLCDDHIDENSDIHCDKCGTSLCGDYHIYDDDTIHYDETHHWYVCAACGDRFEVSEHEICMMEELMPDCENAGIDIEGCYHCDYVRETYYDALGHRDDNDDYVCDNCWTSFCIINGEDHIYEATINDGSNHYSVCTKCNEGWIWSDHVDGNDDGVCDECGGSMDYVEECPHYNTNCYYNNEDEHLYICDDCNEVLYHESHNIYDDDGWCWDCCEYVY